HSGRTANRMTTCLNDSHIQALADGESLPDAAAHVEACANCAARVRARAALMASIVHRLDVPVAIPASFRLKAEATGATRLRESRGFRVQAEGKWIYGLAVAAATLIAVIFVVPAVRKPDATVSASEILA